MELIFQGALATEILAHAKKNPTLLRGLARQWVDQVDPAEMAALLLSRDKALELLTDRFVKSPEATLNALMEMSTQPSGRRVAKNAAGWPARRRSSKSKPVTRKHGRQHSRGQIEQMRAAVLDFLSTHPWSSRKEITAAANIPSRGVYIGVLRGLRNSGQIVGRGDRATRVYALKGTRPAR